MNDYEVLYIVKPVAVDYYPDVYRKDTDKHPELLEYVDDESEIIIRHIETGMVYTASEFFYQNICRRLTITESL